MVEGKQFFVNRITFLGNTTTRDNVIRRELRSGKAASSTARRSRTASRRLNQLGYFKPLEGKEGEMDVQPTPGRTNKVDIKLKFEEQNRNQLAFGAGVSQFDGFFGQLSFQTANFLGRGETLGVSLQKGSQARQYQISFTEPYLFDRPITAGVDVFTRQYIYPNQYTQETRGTNTVFGYPLSGLHARMFLGYSYSRVACSTSTPSIWIRAVLRAVRILRDSLMIDQGGHRTVSKISPSLVYNTVNAPIFPTRGRATPRRWTSPGSAATPRTSRPAAKAIWYIRLDAPHVDRLRAPRCSTSGRTAETLTLPIFEKFFMRRRVHHPRVRHPHVSARAIRCHRHRDGRQQDAACSTPSTTSTSAVRCACWRSSTRARCRTSARTSRGRSRFTSSCRRRRRC